MQNYIYAVHSTDEQGNPINKHLDSLYEEFNTRAEALEYADEYIGDDAYVEGIEVGYNDFGEAEDVYNVDVIRRPTKEVEVEEDSFDEITEEDEVALDKDFSELTEEEAIATEQTLGEYINTLNELEGLDSVVEYLVDEYDFDIESAEELNAVRANEVDSAYIYTDDAGEEFKINTFQDLMDLLKISGADQITLNEQNQNLEEAAKPRILSHQEINDRLDELEARLAAMNMEEAVCKDTKVITHPEDDVKDLKEEIDYDKLREELEENEDEVECQICYDLVPKESAIKTDGGYYICKHCWEENSKNESLENQYKVGQTIRINVLADDPESDKYAGRVGKITSIDGIGQLHGTWGGLAVIPEVDDITVISSEGLTEAVDSEYKKVLKKALTLLKKPGAYGVIIGYDQGKETKYLDKPLLKKSFKEVQDFQKSFSRGKEGTKVIVKTVYPKDIDSIKELLAEGCSHTKSNLKEDFGNSRGKKVIADSEISRILGM